MALIALARASQTSRLAPAAQPQRSYGGVQRADLAPVGSPGDAVSWRRSIFWGGQTKRLLQSSAALAKAWIFEPEYGIIIMLIKAATNVAAFLCKTTVFQNTSRSPSRICKPLHFLPGSIKLLTLEYLLNETIFAYVTAKKAFLCSMPDGKLTRRAAEGTCLE